MRLSDNQVFSQNHHQAPSSSAGYHQNVDSQSNNFYSANGYPRPNSPLRQNSPPNRPCNNEQLSRAKDIVNTTQVTFEKLKKDLSEKEQLLEEKNREILRLRMANEEAVRLQ